MTAELAASPRGPDSTPVEYGRRRGEGASLLHVLAHTDTQSHITVCMHVCMYVVHRFSCMGQGYYCSSISVLLACYVELVR